VCLLVVASRVIPGTPLLIGANRDEFLNRPSVSMTVLRDQGPRILGGRDEKAGGTWLAINEHGVFAGLTNQPQGGGRDDSRRSRGELPLALASHTDAPHAVDAFLGHFEPSSYNGSWLLVGDRHSLYFIDFTGSVPPSAVGLPPGLHVLENRPLGSPSPKADHVVLSLGAMTDDADTVAANLQRVLADHHVPDPLPDQEAPRAASNCVHLDEYGTRSSCIARYGEDPAVRPAVWVADGPPCTTPFVDASALWTSAVP
jgi:uncharacterized protein with NRDE domain